MADLIDRQAVIDALEKDWNGMVVEFNFIRDLPSVEAEPVRHGRWIPVTNGRGGHECSLCHTYAPSFMSGNEWLTDYCPHCGASMRGE